MTEWLRSQGIKDTRASIDRFTHEPISAPVATMSPDQVLIELGKDRTTHPLEALDSADR